MKKPVRRLNWSKFLPAPVIGVDEVGRGCLAGPVVAAAVVLRSISRKRLFFDSKSVPEPRRRELSLKIQSEHQWCLGVATVEEIDRLNIFHASLLAMKRAILGLGVDGGHVLVDGKFTVRDLEGFSQTALVKGDLRVEPISAASLVAKVARDEMMRELAERIPGYGFEIHKGYGTPLHRARLAELGPSEIHRRSFAGIGEAYAEKFGADGDLGGDEVEPLGLDDALS